MKNRYIKTSISVVATILLSYGLVSAWTNLSTVNTGDTLTSSGWNDMIIGLNDAGQRASGIFTDGVGNIGIGTNAPIYKLDVRTNGGNESVLKLLSSGNLSVGLYGGTGLHQFFRFFENNIGKWEVGNSSQTGNKFYFNTTPGAGISGSSLVIQQDGNVGIGTTTPSQKLEVNGVVKASDFQGTLNGMKIAKGFIQFISGSCDSVASPCVIDISSGNFTSAPICTLTSINKDSTGYTENMVIKNTTTTQLNIWKGQYQNEGTTIQVNWICIGS